MFGSSEYSSTFFVKKSQSEAMLMAIESLKQSSMRVVGVDATTGVILAKVSSSLRSMGEDVKIQMEEKDDGTLLTIHSKCNYPGQKFDWGKNEKNVKRITDALSLLQNKDYPDADSSLMAITNQINSTSNGSGCMALLIGLFVTSFTIVLVSVL